MNGKNKSNENIQVYVRCRPINNRERSIHSHETVKVVSDREVVVKQPLDGRHTKKFTFDRAFGPDSKQSDVYQVVVAPLINEVLSGYNCTVFAYGQTGTGKTHTMIGDETPQSSSSYEDSSAMGIIPRALSHMFEELRTMDVEFTMRISYLELYNEELCDLLSSNDVAQIRIFEDPNKKGSIIVQGLEEIPVHSTADVYKLLAKGQEKRRMATTLMNAQSSRSHTVFSILVHIKEKDGIEGEELLKIGKLNLVDLAGSENISKAGNEKGIRTRETVNINQSLLTLGRVITALVERTPHIPYRESKLTRLLQESLGGRTKTSIIATISPGHKDLEETTSTLEYANRAKNIQNKPEVNQKLTKKTVLKEYTEEIDRLKRDLMAARDKNGVYMAEETYNQMNYQLESQKADLTDQINKLKAEKEKVAAKQKELEEISVELDSRNQQLKETEDILTETNEILDRAKRGYQEKKQILAKHVQTEKTLTTQAKQLMDVANVATKDVHKLHETISRRKNYDFNNREACKNLDTNLNSHLTTMTNNIDEYKSALNDQTLLLINKMGANTKQSKELCVTMLAKISTLIEVEQEGKRVIEECLASGKTDVEEIFRKHLEEKDKILKAAEQQREALKNQYLELQANIDESYKEFDESELKLQNLHENHFDFVSSHQNEVRRSLVKKSDATVEGIQSSRQTLATSTEKHDELTSKLSSLLDEMKVLVDQSRGNNQMVRGVANDLGKVKAQIQNDLAENLDVFDKFKTQMTNNNTAMTSTLGACKTAAKNIKSNVSEMVRVSSENEDDLVATIAEMDKNFVEQKNVLTDKVYDMFNQIENTCEMTRIDIDGGLNGVIKDVTDEQDRLVDYQFEFDDTMTTLEATQNEFHDTLNSDIEFCQQRLQKFQNDELQIYTPTGQTPSKREYSYPRKLATTSPHGKIIADFWSIHNPADLNCSAIISEETIRAESPTVMESTENDSIMENTLQPSVLEQSVDRTLCDSQQFNANSMSTPFTSSLRKQIPTQNLSNIEVSSICEENKEN
ncbi:kinesin-like protein Klp61F isoform X2 [Sitodiplosis mosellana]|uniref:kinesin-like protein Klp61F isoform X2 n=1 Tax=Sitodiplosis mosellana TaxID=263140 RepID=UPI002444E2A2|nr:kinesin-like protein Klp61F isoform X2 [Sitodiplosis mosellana]